VNQAEQKARYVDGVVIEIVGQETKAENGRFVICGQFPDQPNGDAYFQYVRIDRHGSRMTRGTRNQRGHRFSWLEQNAAIVA
jgi:hypothetical protein